MAVQKADIESFVAWRPADLHGEPRLELGDVCWQGTGKLRIELLRPDTLEPLADLIFDAPLAMRATDSGSLDEYWRAGLRAIGFNLFVASTTPFLRWLERSSGGVQHASENRHYALLTDGTCVEVVSRTEPRIRMRNR